MFTFLEDPTRITRGFHQFPKFDSYRRDFLQNINRTVSYFKRNDFAVRSDHVLVRLLQTLPSKYMGDVNLYYQEIHDVAYETCGHLRITNPYYVGDATEKAWLFGGDFTEFPIALHDTKGINVREACLKWQDLAPLRFVRHPRTDLGLLSPMGNVKSDEPGIVVYQIDVPMMALQHYMWRLEQESKPKGERETTAQFVSKYVLSNSIRSMVDVAFFNRLAAKFIEDDVENSQWRYPLALPNNLRMLDLYLEDVCTQLRGNSYRFSELLFGLKTLSGAELYSLCEFPKTVFTRQCNWLTYMAQAPYVNFLLNTDRESTKTQNLSDLNEIRRDIRYAFNDNLFKSKLPNYLLKSVVTEFRDIQLYNPKA